MKTITVKTGYGYLTDEAGNIVSKSELSFGKHKIKDHLTYHEVANQQELDSIEVYKKPLTEEEIEARLIKQKKEEILERQAIQELQDEGKIRRK